MHFNPSKKLDDIQAKQIVREIVRLGDIIYGCHAKERMIERGYTIRDVVYILKNGEIIKKEFNQDCQNWKYTFQSEDLDGISGTAVRDLEKNNLPIKEYHKKAIDNQSVTC